MFLVAGSQILINPSLLPTALRTQDRFRICLFLLLLQCCIFANSHCQFNVPPGYANGHSNLSIAQRLSTFSSCP